MNLKDLILIVDDDEMVCRILSQKLTSEGYSCATTSNGKEALSYFYKDDYSLIIADIKMPEMDGLEILKTIKATNPSTIVVMITGYPEIETVVEALRLGAYDFIMKPFNLDLVVHTVKRAIEKKELAEGVQTYQVNLAKLAEERAAELQMALQFLNKSHLDSVKVLARAIEERDPYTRGKFDQVQRMCLQIANSLGFTKKRVEILKYGALVYDIGKIGIKDELLQKLGVLTPEEFRHIQEHTLIGVRIVEGIEFFEDKIPIIRHHHEHFDGSGYPDRLVGKAIPLEARIIAVLDAFDAMTRTRSYRGAKPLKEVLLEMEKGKGNQFDPHILEIFLQKKIYSLSM